MRHLLTVCSLFISLVSLSAQYTPLFVEDFSTNKHGWKVSEKAPILRLNKKTYSLQNEQGKQPMIALVDVPMQESKNVRIQTMIKPVYKPGENPLTGVFFGATDEKNGFIFVLKEFDEGLLLKSVDGKLEILNGFQAPRQSPDAAGYKGDKFDIRLEYPVWKFYVNDSLVYYCPPKPWMGTQVGFYTTPHAGLSVTGGLTVSEDQPGENVCPLPFTQEMLQEELPQYICAAAEDFENMRMFQTSSENGLTLWEMRTRLPGALDNFWAVDSMETNKKGKDFVIMYVCQEHNDPISMMPMFEEFRKAINMLDISCVDLKENEVLEFMREDNLRAVTWLADIESSKFGLSKLKVELDLNHLGVDYFIVLHVNIVK